MTKYKNAQKWLNLQYPNKDQVETIEFDSELKFEQSSELIINDYPNLKEIQKNYIRTGVSSLKLTKITISNCPQLETVCIDSFKNFQELILNNLPNLKKISCSHNSLTEVKFTNAGEKLEHLDLSNNNFSQDLSFLSHLINLEELDLRRNNFVGSLEYLKKINKLKKLVISSTYIDSGLEYLSDSLEDFYCSAGQKEDAKSKVIYNLFAGGKTPTETEEWDEKIKNLPQNLHDYKQWRSLDFSEEEIKQWINAGFTLNDYEDANQFKKEGYRQNIPVEEIIEKESWKDIHLDFNYQLRKKWEKINFTKQKTKEWINSNGVGPDCYSLAGLASRDKQTEEKFRKVIHIPPKG